MFYYQDNFEGEERKIDTKKQRTILSFPVTSYTSVTEDIEARASNTLYGIVLSVRYN